MKKKVISLVMAVVMCVGLAAPAFSMTINRTDVDASTGAGDAAEEVSCGSIIRKLYGTVQSDAIGVIGENISENSFGGLYRDDDGNLVVNVVDLDETTGVYAHLDSKTADKVKIKKVKYSLDYLEDAADMLVPYMKKYSIITLDADDKTNQLVIGITNAGEDNVAELLAAIESMSIPSECVKIIDRSGVSLQNTVKKIDDGLSVETAAIAEGGPKPTQFEVFQGIPYCVMEGVLYRYADTDWVYAEYPEQIKQLVPGDNLCAVDSNGNVIFEADLSISGKGNIPSLTGYFIETAQNFIDLNQTTPFVEISGDIMLGPSALLENGSILMPVGDHYEQYAMEEKPIALSGGFILTEDGNVYQQSDPMDEKPEVHCVYHGGNIAAICGNQLTGECVGLTKKGTVLSWNTSRNANFDVPSVTEWKDVVAVKQGHHFVVALTKAGKVLYADSNKEHTEKIGNEFAEWRDITNISISGMTVYGLESTGNCLLKNVVIPLAQPR